MKAISLELALVALSFHYKSLTRATEIGAHKSLAGSESGRCRICSAPLMELLNGIQQDINYANKTISLDKLTTSLYRNLDELEGLYREHSVGLKDSQDALRYSLDHLASSLKLNKNTDLKSKTLEELIENLDLDTTALQARVQANIGPGARMREDMDRLMLRLEQAFERHTSQQIGLSEIRAKLISSSSPEIMASDQISPFAVKLFAKQSNALIVDQIVDGALLKSIFRNASRQINQVDERIHECRSYMKSRASSLVGGRLIGSGQTDFRSTGSTLAKQLSFVTSSIGNRTHTSNHSETVGGTVGRSMDPIMVKEKRNVSGNRVVQLNISQAMSASRKRLSDLARRLQEAHDELELLRSDSVRLENLLESTLSVSSKLKAENSRLRKLRLDSQLMVLAS